MSTLSPYPPYRDDRHGPFEPPDVGAALCLLDDVLAEARDGSSWRAELAQVLEVLTAALHRETTQRGDDSLLSEIERSAPHLASRLQRLRSEYAHALGDTLGLTDRAGSDDSSTDELRDGAATLARRLHRARTTESDLIFEALHRDIGGGD